MIALNWFLFFSLFVPLSAQLLNGTCEEDHCGPNGQCINTTETQFFCRCEDGFGGAFCEHSCSSECDDGEKCVILDNKTPLCLCENCENKRFLLIGTETCEPGFGGFDCSIPVNSPGHNPCHSKPCNYGVCLRYEDRFYCICESGFDGPNCTRIADNCTDHQCQNGAECVVTGAGYYCRCPQGRSGKFCQDMACEAVPGVCNNGRCRNMRSSEDRGFECICDEGFEGEFCNLDVDECAGKSPCYNESICVNLPGSFRCDCTSGFKGKRCTEPVDLCEFTKCENNGSCLHTVFQEPVCQCLNGFVGSRCEKPCISGFGGVNCNIPLRTGVCGKPDRPCENGGKCYKHFCTCPPNYVGDNCEFRRRDYIKNVETCEMDPCNDGATCIDVDGELGHFCKCEPGFTGDKCQLPTSLCEKNPCANGGTCTENNAKFTCNCPPGYEGERCEQMTECSVDWCFNDGFCRIAGNSSVCKCPIGFSGAMCEKNELNEKAAYLGSICETRNCSDKANNGLCDTECNQAQCLFDGGDCSGGRIPFSECPFHCADVFADGTCDFECNTEECLFDGFDCEPKVAHCPLRIRSHCAARFFNGICDKECNSQGCGFDGGDCKEVREKCKPPGIRLALDMSPGKFQEIQGKVFMGMSAELNTTIRIRKDEDGLMVFKWNGKQELGRIDMQMDKNSFKILTRRNSLSLGVVVYLEEFCEGTCKFTSPQSFADLFGAKLSKTNGRTAFGLPIKEASIARHTPKRGLFSFIVSVFFLMAVIIFGVGIERWRRKRSIKRRWIPPLFSENFGRSMEKINEWRAEKQIDKEARCGSFIPDVNDEEIIGPAAEEIPLHVEAAGPKVIMEHLSKETVRMIDSKYRRNVLHWLASNTNRKDDETIVFEVANCIEVGADVNALDVERNSPLLLAVAARRYRVALIFLLHGADPSVFNCFDKNALHIAASNQDFDMMRILLSSYTVRRDIEELDGNGMTALMIVASCHGYQQVSLATLLVNSQANVNEDGSTRGDFELVNGRTALHFAAAIGNLELINYFLTCNVNVDKQDKAGQTPMMLAAKEGHANVVRTLVQNSASILITDLFQKTAAQHARENYHRDIADYLDDVEARIQHDAEIQKEEHERQMKRQWKFFRNARLTPPRSDGESSSSSTSSPPPRSPPGNESHPNFNRTKSYLDANLSLDEGYF